MILNLAGMAIIIMCWILPSTSRRIVENRKRRRERRRAGHYDTYEDTSNIGPLFIVMLIPVASVIFSISNIFSIINDAFHLF